MFRDIPDEETAFGKPAAGPAIPFRDIPPDPEAQNPAPASAVQPRAVPFADMPAEPAVVSTPSFSDIPPDPVTQKPGWWKRKAQVAGAGIINWAANVAGSVTQTADLDERWRKDSERWAKDKDAIVARFNGNEELAKQSVFGFGQGDVSKSPSERARKTREQIKALTPAAWQAAMGEEMQRKYPDLPNPFTHPGEFLGAAAESADVAVSQTAANSGNLLTARFGKGPGVMLAAVSMADQEAAGFMDNWSAQAGLPTDFVAPYAKTYGMLSAPVEYAQNALMVGNGAVLKAAGKVPGLGRVVAPGMKLVKRVAGSRAGRALLATLNISVEGVEELSQSLIEHKVAEKMARDWNAQHPDAQPIAIPAYTTDDAWQNFKAGAGMGILAEGGKAGARTVKNLFTQKPAATGPAAAPAPPPAQGTEAAGTAPVEQPGAGPVADPSATAPVEQPVTEQPVVEPTPTEAPGAPPPLPAPVTLGNAIPGSQIQGTKKRAAGTATAQQQAFDREVPAGDFPLLSMVVQANGIQKPANMAEDYGGPEGRDVAQLIYNTGSSVTADEAARMARERGLIREGYEGEFWDRLGREVEQYRRMKSAGHKNMADMAASEEADNAEGQWKLATEQAARFGQANRPDPARVVVPASELREGDALVMGGRRMEVRAVDQERGEVVLVDPGIKGFGTQSIPLADTLHADRVLQDGMEEDADARSMRFAMDAALRFGARGPVQVPAGELAAGDRVQVGPTVLTVRGVTADGESIELDDLDGMRMYGRVQVPGAAVLAVDAVTKADAGGDDAVPFYPRQTRAGMGSGGTRETAGAAIPPARGARIDRIGADGDATTDPRYTRVPMRLHHLVDLVKAMGASIRTGNGRGKWLGLFRATDKGAAGVKQEILLRPELFKLVPDARAVELRAEAKTEAAAMFGKATPAALAAREEQLFQEKFQRERNAALEKGTPEALAVAWHEVGHLVDYAPDKTLKRGNLLGHLAALKGYMKSMLQERAGAGRLIPPAVLRILDRDARISAGKRPKTGGTDMEAWEQRRREAYKSLLRREADRRGLITLEQIDEETRGVVAWWNGTADMPAYFEPASERYAEVFSVLANNPAALERMAPTFWRAWNNFLKARPDAARVMDLIQEDIATGADMSKMREKIRDGIPTAELDREEYQRQQINSRRTLWDYITYYAFRAQGPIDWQIIKAEQRALRENGVNPVKRWTAAGASALALAAERAGTGRLRAALGNFRYATTWAELYQHDMRNEVLQPMWKAGVGEKDFAEYMIYRHIVENRPDNASTGGVDPAAALKALREMEATNPEQFAAMKTGAERWFAVRSRHVLAALEKAGMLDDKLRDTLRTREAYVTFLPVFDKVGENDPEGLVAEMAKKFGPGVTSHIGFQKGWLGGIKDPIAATMQKDRKIIRAAMRNMAAQELGKFLQAQQAANPEGRPLIAPADPEMSGGKMGTRMLTDSSADLGDLIWIENGEKQHYYIPRAYVEFLNGMHPNQLIRIMHAVNAIFIVPVKRSLVDWSAGSWPWLATKDFRAFMQQTPGINPARKLRGVRDSFRAARSISAGAPNDLARMAMERGMVLSKAQRSGFDEGESAQQREVNIFGVMKRSEEKTRDERFHAIREVGRAYADFADKFNKTMSATWKIQATRLLDEQFPAMPEWQKAELVRGTAGNPDFLHRSAAASMIDWQQLYYNAAKEGRMASIKAFQNHPASYIANSLIWTVAPALLMKALGEGLVSKALKHLLKPEDLWEVEELEEMMKWIPSYEKLRNQCIPLGWADKKMKRVVYLRLPLSEGEMPAHAFIQAAANGEADAGGAINTMFLASSAGAFAPGNPISNVAEAWWDYYLARRNPYDSFRGSLMMSDTEYKAGGAYAAARLAKFTWDSFVGSLLGRLPYSQSPYAPEKTTGEKVLQTPVVSALVGKWVRVSSGFDEEAKLLADKMDTRQARARLDVQRLVRAALDGDKAVTPEQMQAVMGDPYKARYMENYVKQLGVRQSMGPDVRSIMEHVSADGTPDEVAMELLRRRGAR